METPRITDYGDTATDEYGNECFRCVNLLRKPLYCDVCDRPIRKHYWCVSATQVRCHTRCVKVHTVIA